MKNVKTKLSQRKAKNTETTNKATESIVDSLIGSKTKIKIKSSVGLRLKSTKSVSKKCSDKEKSLIKKPPTPSTPPKPVCQPVIFIQDNLIRASLYADLNALHLDTTNGDNCIDFDVNACLKFCENGINFYIEASENPMPDLLEEEGVNCFVKRFRQKGIYPNLQAMIINVKGKTVYDSAITYPQLLKLVERGLSKLIRVSGNLTLPQAQNLKLELVEGKHFSYYSRK